MKTRTALITGASRGIGFAIAECLKNNGVRVLTPSRDELDLISNESIDAYLMSISDKIDILINNAGINILASCTEVSDDNIQKTIQTNLLAPLRLVRSLAIKMKKNKYGRIVNISSIWGEITKPGRITYSISKSGINGMTRTLAVELAPYNILVNAVAPGYVNTELTKQNNTESELKSIEKTIPIQRLAEPSEIAEVVAFLASEKNTYITGQIVIVDGGFICQ